MKPAIGLIRQPDARSGDGLIRCDEFRYLRRSERVLSNSKEAVVSITKTRIDKITTVIIPVSDQDRALEFYVGTLGLAKRVDLPFGKGYRWVEVGPADTETTI